MDWRSVFDEAEPEPGASEAEIARFVEAVRQPLSAAEITAAKEQQQNPYLVLQPSYYTWRPYDPSVWVMPGRPLPPAYLDFLRWSNGGWCRTGERELGFFSTDHPTGGVRAMTLGYEVPQYMPGALPFAFNGGGTFYLFDMREEMAGGEYPVVCAHSGSLGWDPDGHRQLADSFEAACRGTTDVDAEEEDDEEEEPAARCLRLAAPGPNRMAVLRLIRSLDPSRSPLEAKRLMEQPDAVLFEGTGWEVEDLRRRLEELGAKVVATPD